MTKYAAFIVLATIAAVSMLTGRTAVAGGNPCKSRACYRSAAGFGGAVWRMEVLVDEAAFRGPSVQDRLNYNWTNAASRRYRWTSTVMPVDNRVSTQMVTFSARVIAAGVPLLRKGDIVDVAVAAQGIDYSHGRAPVILRRVCAARDERCLDGLRKKQNGRESGVEVRGGYRVASNRKRFSSVANFFRAALLGRCREEVR